MDPHSPPTLVLAKRFDIPGDHRMMSQNEVDTRPFPHPIVQRPHVESLEDVGNDVYEPSFVATFGTRAIDISEHHRMESMTSGDSRISSFHLETIREL